MRTLIILTLLLCAAPALAQPQDGAQMFPAQPDNKAQPKPYIIAVPPADIERDLKDFARRFGTSSLPANGGYGCLFGESFASPQANMWARKTQILLQGANLQIEDVQVLSRNIRRDGLATRALVRYRFRFPDSIEADNRQLWERPHQEIMRFNFEQVNSDPDVPVDFITEQGKRSYRESYAWRIVPPAVEPPTLQAEFFSAEEANFWANVAYHLAQKPTLPASLADRSLYKLWQLGVSMIWLAQEHGGSYAVAPNFIQTLTPYAQNFLIFQIPDSKEYYTFNSNLLNLQSNELAAPDKTVLFYEGQSQKPIFRYDGKAAICFADGHVALVSPEQAQKLIWKP